MTRFRQAAAAVLLMLVASACTPAQVQLWWTVTGHDVPLPDDVAAVVAVWATDPLPDYDWARDVEHAVVAAAAEFGVDLALMAKIIQCESGGNPRAQNPRSSASGLGQFLDSTWASNAPSLGYEPTRAASYDVTAGARVMAKVMSEQGTSPWNASRHCWRRH